MMDKNIMSEHLLRLETWYGNDVAVIAYGGFAAVKRAKSDKETYEEFRLLGCYAVWLL
jgi:hypothetical protein